MRRNHGNVSDPLHKLFSAASLLLSHTVAMDMLLSRASISVQVALKSGATFNAIIPENGVRIPYTEPTFIVDVPQEVSGDWKLQLQVREILTPDLLEMPDPIAKLELKDIDVITVVQIIAGDVVFEPHPRDQPDVLVSYPFLLRLVTIFGAITLSDGRQATFDTAKVIGTQFTKELLVLEGGVYDFAAASAVGYDHVLPIFGVNITPGGDDIMFYAVELVREAQPA